MIVRPALSSFNPSDGLGCRGKRGKECCVRSGLKVRLAVLALLVATIAGCTGVRVPKEWEPLLDEVRAFEQRIGFRKTATGFRKNAPQPRSGRAGYNNVIFK